MKNELNWEINRLYQEDSRFKDFNGYILIKKGDDICFQQNFGYADYENKISADDNTLYHMGSITKQFTAFCVLQLHQAGLISIDNPITAYLPDLIYAGNISIRDMLNMISGIPEYWCKSGWQENEDKTTDDAYEFIKTLTDYYPARTRFEYCNSNYIILGKLIEKISGLSLGDYYKQHIFLPLSMDRSDFLKKGETYSNFAVGYKSPRVSKWEKAAPIYSFAGAGGILTTAADLCKWNEALYTEKVLSRTLIEEAFRPVMSGYAMGWYVNGDKVFHGGDAPGFSTRLTRIAQGRILILLLCNFEGCAESNMGHYADSVEKLVAKFLQI